MRQMLCALLIAMAGGAHAEEELGPRVRIELNTVTAGADGCTLTFLVQNGHASEIAQAVYETVLFDRSGQVDRLTLFDFGALPPARPRVRQFVIPGLACAGIGRLLFNGAETCTAPDLAASACEDGLEVQSRIAEIEVLG